MGKSKLSKKQHTIPQFYLNNFAVKEKNKYRFYTFSKNELKKWKSSVNEVGYIKDYNTIKVNGEKNDLFEKAHNIVFEQKFSVKLKSIINKIFQFNQIENECYNCMSVEFYKSDKAISIDYYDKRDIAYILGYFILRGRKLRNSEELFIDKVKEIYKDMLNSNKNLNQDKVLNDFINYDTKEDVKQSQLISLFKIDSLNELAEIIYNHIWEIAYNNTDELLYTSDNGHALCNLTNLGKSIGYSTNGNIILFPLTPRICIIMYDKKQYNKEKSDLNFTNLDKLKIKWINENIIYDGIDEVYSQDGNWEILNNFYSKTKLPKGHKPYSVS